MGEGSVYGRRSGVAAVFPPTLIGKHGNGKQRHDGGCIIYSAALLVRPASQELIAQLSKYPYKNAAKPPEGAGTVGAVFPVYRAHERAAAALCSPSQPASQPCLDLMPSQRAACRLPTYQTDWSPAGLLPAWRIRDTGFGCLVLDTAQ